MILPLLRFTDGETASPPVPVRSLKLCLVLHSWGNFEIYMEAIATIHCTRLGRKKLM
jgi:hypothetical protein